MFPTTIRSDVHASPTSERESVTTAPEGWHTQAEDYGRRFSAVYDAVFPMDAAAEAAADLLFRLGTAAAVTVSDGDTHRSSPVLAEFGVGSGRVALPLVLRGASVTGVDRSPELLAAAARRAVESCCRTIDLVHGDIRTWSAPRPVDVAYCICATLSMLEHESEHRQVLRNMARSIHSAGFVVVETHSPERIRALHRSAPVMEFDTAVDGLPGGLHSRSELDADGSAWSVHHTWSAPAPAAATEYSRLIEPRQLVALAAAAGLEMVTLASGWSSEPLDPLSPTYVCVLRPATADPSETRTMSDPAGPAESGWTR
jgi:2-polyprenyl-3-methyl-5-hydroxy-6-metoxy-1,4-benzoquinol methylase